MSPWAAVPILAGAAVAAIAGLGMVRLNSTFARFHAAGKASPIAVVLVCIGGVIELGGTDAGRLLIAAGLMTVTMPIGVHLLFRATYRAPGIDGQSAEVRAPGRVESTSDPGSSTDRT